MSNMSKEIEEHVPFLADDNVEKHHQLQMSRAPLARRIQASWLKVALAVYSVAATGALVYLYLHGTPEYQPYTPAQHKIEFETIKADPHWHMPYTAPPSDEVDEAWDKLVSPIYFSATADEVRASNEDPDDTVRVLEDGGYLGTIGVYHGLHCLRRIYWQLHEETYFPNRTSARRDREIEHASHCLGVIIRDLQCMPDTALYTFKYDPEEHPTPRLKSGAQRTCMKWEPFHEWASSRAPGYRPRVKVPENFMNELREAVSMGEGMDGVEVPAEVGY